MQGDAVEFAKRRLTMPFIAAIRSTRDAHAADDLVWTAAQATRDLTTAKPLIFWSDLLSSAIVGYAGLAVAMTAKLTLVQLAAGVVSILALYRAQCFIHELTHLKRGAVRGFHGAWNMLVGVPMMTPSFLYEGVHNLHHAHGRYGTVKDPEYLRLAHIGRWGLLALLAGGALAPVALLIRFAILAPASAMFPGVRRPLVERFSALAINPAFRRQKPIGARRRSWVLYEALTGCLAIVIIVCLSAGIIPPGTVAVYLAVLTGIAVLNNLRTLASHLWESQGEPLSIKDQFLDSVNIPQPSIFAELWAPVGLRYHALHHLLPGIPYHALGQAHRRLMSDERINVAYRRSNKPGLVATLHRLMESTGRRAAITPYQSEPVHLVLPEPDQLGSKRNYVSTKLSVTRSSANSTASKKLEIGKAERLPAGRCRQAAILAQPARSTLHIKSAPIQQSNHKKFSGLTRFKEQPR